MGIGWVFGDMDGGGTTFWELQFQTSKNFMHKKHINRTIIESTMDRSDLRFLRFRRNLQNWDVEEFHIFVDLLHQQRNSLDIQDVWS